MTKNLDYEFDEFLKHHEADVVGSIPKFYQRLEKSRFKYSRFVIPTFYKLHFLTHKQENIFKRVSNTLTQIINNAARLYFEEAHLAHLFHLSPEAAELVKIDPGYSQSIILSRFDGFLEGESLKLVEFNCDAPAGAAYTDELEGILLEDEVLQDFVRDYQLKRHDRVQGLLTALLGAYEEFGGFETPNIAVMDWRNVRTAPEAETIKLYFETKGYKTVIADPRELKYKGGKLYHKNFRVDIILRRAGFDEILERIDEVQDLIKAYRDHAVCMVNPLRAWLANTKALLSILTNPEFDHFFTENENKIKREHLPWTRRMVDAEDFYGRKKIYLIDFLKDEKESLVLKPSLNYGGKGVTIGRETRDDDWNAAIDRALKDEWVVQEYINIPIMTVPIIINNKLDFAYKKYNFNMLAFGGKFQGGFIRVSDESVVNVAKGGGMIPSLVPETVPDRLEV